MTAYYNEIDPFAAAWLRVLIAEGHIAPGIVDERSIEDVRPDELTEFTQCHFFAGIGVWSYALRQAGWPDDRPVWTGSCPCQPFSSAGKGGGFDDERHLWPSFAWIIQQSQPTVLLGEQVASKATGPWFDLVQSDLEAMGYAFGCVPFPSAGVGAPHIRDRAYWVADSGGGGRYDRRREPVGGDDVVQRGEKAVGRVDWGEAQERCAADGLAKPNSSGLQQGSKTAEAVGHGNTVEPDGGDSRPSPTNGIWRDADWLYCRDGKWRPVEPGTFPLVNGATNRVGRLRGYGNAINAEAARVWIETVMQSLQTITPP